SDAGLHGVLGRHLVAHQADGLRAWADEHETRLLDALGKVRVLGQEAVAGVDCLGVGDFGGRDDGRHVEVALRGGRGADADRLVGQADVLGLGVGGGMHGDGLDAELTAGPQDAQGDFPAVRDQDLLEHGRAQSMTKRGWPYSTGSPFSTRMALITPLASASISFISFVASMMHRRSPSETDWPTSTSALAPGAPAR